MAKSIILHPCPTIIIFAKDYVIDYTDPLKRVILESEGGAGGLTYRHVYGLEKVETVISGIANGAGSIMQYIVSDETRELVLTNADPGKDVIKNGIVKLYSHHDHLGTTDYLTDNVSGKVVSYVSYDDWGALTAKAVLKMGARELDLVQDYTGHPYDSVLDIYYAKARMYDAADRRFMAVDIIKGTKLNPQSLVQYTYVQNGPVSFVDAFGKSRNAARYTKSDPYATKEKIISYNGIEYVSIHEIAFALSAIPEISANVYYTPKYKNRIQIDGDVKLDIKNTGTDNSLCLYFKMSHYNEQQIATGFYDKISAPATLKIRGNVSTIYLDVVYSMEQQCNYVSIDQIMVYINKILSIPREKVKDVGFMEAGIYNFQVLYYMEKLDCYVPSDGEQLYGLVFYTAAIAGNVSLVTGGIGIVLNGIAYVRTAGGFIKLGKAWIDDLGRLVIEGSDTKLLPGNTAETKLLPEPSVTWSKGINDLPDNALSSFMQYEKNGWSGSYPGQTAGTRAGGTYSNTDMKLPTSNSQGGTITYREFDVNNKVPGMTRDAERFVVGNDGSVYYTVDHYNTFLRIK